MGGYCYFSFTCQSRWRLRDEYCELRQTEIDISSAPDQQGWVLPLPMHDGYHAAYKVVVCHVAAAAGFYASFDFFSYRSFSGLRSSQSLILL